MISPAVETSGFTLMRRRWLALALRIIYLHKESWPRLIEVIYWPTINLLVWGFTSLYIMREIGHVSVVLDVMVGGILLGEVFLRTQLGILLLFMEEVWSRNLGHLFASPMRLADYIIGLFGLSFIRMILAMITAIIVANSLFNFNILHLGWALAPYVILLAMNGWWCGLLLIAMLIRFGLAVEWLAWMSSWLTMPLIAPYYPVSVLPKVLQYLSYSLPATYVFEAMKDQAAGLPATPDKLWIALGSNISYLVLAVWVFRRSYDSARNRGSLMQMGE